MSITIKNLSYSYDNENMALDNVSLDIEKGMLYGVIGETGCGKSTLAQLIAGLIKPDSGSIIIDGDDINSRKFDKAILRRKLGILFQYPEMQLFAQSVEKDVQFALKRFKLSKAEKAERVKYALELVGLDYDSFKDKSPLSLSGGEKRRVALAGVLVTKPDYIILDEPVAGLDPLSRQKFMLMLKKLCDCGATVIMISHNADVISEFSDRVIVMENGRVIMCDTPFNVYSSPCLKTAKCTVKKICDALSDNGIDLDENTITYNDLLNQLIKRFK